MIYANAERIPPEWVNLSDPRVTDHLRAERSRQEQYRADRFEEMRRNAYQGMRSQQTRANIRYEIKSVAVGIKRVTRRVVKCVVWAALVMLALSFFAALMRPTPPPPPPVSTACVNIQWHAVDIDGRTFTPTDTNKDGKIDCESDIEMGR